MKFKKTQTLCLVHLGLQPPGQRKGVFAGTAKKCREYIEDFLEEVPSRQLFDSSDTIQDFEARARNFVSEYGERLWGQAARSRLAPGAPFYPRDIAL